MGSLYRENYLAALEVAQSDLDRIIQQFDSLQLRKQQIDLVVGALEPFLRSAPKTTREIQAEPVDYEFHQPDPIHIEPVESAPAARTAEPAFRSAEVSAGEPVAPAAFSPRSDGKMDPIQSRINRALGLAVA